MTRRTTNLTEIILELRGVIAGQQDVIAAQRETITELAESARKWRQIAQAAGAELRRPRHETR